MTKRPVKQAIGMGTELGLAMGLLASGLLVGSLFLGRWLDRVLGTTPILTIALLLVGAFVGQLAVYRMAMRSTAGMSHKSLQKASETHVSVRLKLVAQSILAIAVPSLAGALVGLLLDKWLGSKIAFTITLALLGLVGGGAIVAQIARTTASSSE